MRQIFQRFSQRQSVVVDNATDTVLNQIHQLRRIQIVFRAHAVHFPQKQNIPRIRKIDRFLRGAFPDRNAVFLRGNIILHLLRQHETEKLQNQLPVHTLLPHADQIRRLRHPVDSPGNPRKRQNTPVVHPLRTERAEKLPLRQHKRHPPLAKLPLPVAGGGLLRREHVPQLPHLFNSADRFRRVDLHRILRKRINQRSAAAKHKVHPEKRSRGIIQETLF